MKLSSIFSKLLPRKAPDNVIQLSQHRKKSKKKPVSPENNNKSLTSASQKCTYCRQEAPITFYAGHDGIVVGVCRTCKPVAEKQDMLPI